MSSFYSRAAATALKLIEKRGRKVTLFKPDSGTFNAAEGRYTTVTASAGTEVKAAVLPVSEMNDNRYISDMVQGKLRKVLIAAKGLTITPEAGDTLVDGTDKYEVVGSTPLAPGPTIVYHSLLARMK